MNSDGCSHMVSKLNSRRSEHGGAGVLLLKVCVGHHFLSTDDVCSCIKLLVLFGMSPLNVTI